MITAQRVFSTRRQPLVSSVNRYSAMSQLYIWYVAVLPTQTGSMCQYHHQPIINLLPQMLFCNIRL